MKSLKILYLLAVLLPTCVTSMAQSAHYRSLNDTLVVKYLTGGYVKEGKLYLMANDAYSTLDINRKRELLNSVAKGFPYMDITVSDSHGRRELWGSSDAGVFLTEQWRNDDMQIDDYKPLELKRNGNNKLFYYVGGAYNNSDGYCNGSLNLRAGTYLYQNIVDVSTTLSIGYAKTSDATQFTGSVGADSRYYLPFRPKTINLTPYVGGGIAWIFAPEKQFELRLLAGACLFIGPGSFDLGVQYGTASGVSATIGYTFRPSLKN